jgi:MoaA/NifB/PqqE/SkfB family radical SAM enzyme
MSVKKDTYISAGVFPIKLLKNNIIKNGKIQPLHVQLYPTNLCNQNCSFCSCANRNKKDVLPLNEIELIMKEAKECGCKAMTISGGGEPTIHPHINEIIEIVRKLGISIGMAANGLNLKRVKLETLNKLTWCRISHDDNRSFDSPYKSMLSKIINKCPDVDWGFSYVVTANINYKTLKDVIKFSHLNKFTHVRIISDLLDLENVVEMDEIKKALKGVDDSHVIYQGRKTYTKGYKKCLISLLKPVVNADGKLYGCCGIQYISDNPSLKCDKDLAMGDALDIAKLYEKQQFFDGSVCDRCYYSKYNELLNYMTQDLDHVEFV